MNESGYFLAVLESIEYFAHVNAPLAYCILGFSAFVENIIPPVPGDMVVVFGAILVGRESLNILFVFIATSLGSFLGFMSLYCVGLLLGKPWMQSNKRRFFKKEQIEKAQKHFRRYGYWIILCNRFLPALRSIISITAGLLKLHWGRVSVLAFISCALWNGILLYLGSLAGANLENIYEWVQKYNVIAVSFILVGVLIVVLRQLVISRRGARGA